MGIARIVAGVVSQIDRTTDIPPAGWVVCGEAVSCGMLWQGGAFVMPEAPALSTLEKIRALEATVTPRRLREALLSDAGKAWLANVDAAIATERAKL